MTPGSLAELEDYLNGDSRRCTDGISNSQTGAAESSTTTANMPVQTFKPTPVEPLSDNQEQLPEGLRLRGHGRTKVPKEVDADRSWVLPLFQYERYGTKVKHLAVNAGV